DLRARWRAWIALAVLVGLFGGTVIAAAAGARRTDSSYQRFLRWAKAPDFLVFQAPGESGSFARLSRAQLAALPQVAHVATAASFAVVRPAEEGVIAPTDGIIGGTLFRRKMLAGRVPRPDRA